jgi:hypothetical protein
MPELPQSTIIGSWRIVRAELPSTDDPATERFLHFTSDGLHYWEHPFSTGHPPRLAHFRYHMTDCGVFITPLRQQKGWEVPFSADGDCLVFARGAKRWWLRRIPPSERPEYLTHYYDPPAQPTFASPEDGVPQD